MDSLRRGRVLVTNWHVFERRSPQTAGDASAKVVQVGVPIQTTELIRNNVVADNSWESSSAYLLDNHPGTATFKNQGLGFAVPSLATTGILMITFPISSFTSKLSSPAT